MRPKFKSADDPAFRRLRGMMQALRLGLVEMRQQGLATSYVENDEEAAALRAALLAHTRDPQGGLETFRLRERAASRAVQTVVDRVANEGQGLA